MTLPLFPSSPLSPSKLPELRKYQQNLIDRLRSLVESGKKRILIVGPTGCGKTVILASLIRTSSLPVIFVAHRKELIDQCARELGKQGISHIGVMRGDDERVDPSATIQVASIQTLARRDKPFLGKPVIIIIDECFPAGTEVDGRPIESLRAGDIVSSFTLNGRVQKKRVVRTFCKSPGSLVRLRIGKTTLVCTPNHKLWSRSGWVTAGESFSAEVAVEELQNDVRSMHQRDEQACTTRHDRHVLRRMYQDTKNRAPDKTLLRMRQTDRAQEGSEEPLLFAGTQSSHRPTGERKIERVSVGLQQEVCFSAHDREQSHEIRGHQIQGIKNLERYELETEGAWRQRSTNDTAAENIIRSAWLEYGTRRKNRNTKRWILRNLLQDRRRQQVSYDCNRDRRQFSPRHIGERERQKETRLSRFERVDRVEILERGSDGTFGGLCPDGLVYNIEVEDNHTYFANGVAVSNCHRAAADSYLNLLAQYPDAIVFGFTATPVRQDGKPLGGDLFEEMVIAATYSELIKQKYIVEPTCYGWPLPDLSSVRIVGGDFDEDQLAVQMNQNHLVGQVVEHWLKLAEHRRTLVFAVNIAHSQALATKFEAAGVRVAHLDGTTPGAERENIIRALGCGELEVVTNCQIFTEGVDIPPVKCICHARPTLSLVLYMQTSGRMLRPWNDVTPLLLDHAGNFDRHYGGPHEDRHWSLVHKPQHLASVVRMKLCKQCFAYIEPGRITCPHCGFVFPQQAPQKTPTETAQELVKRSADPEHTKRDFYERMVRLARTRGFAPGFPSVKFKEQYGGWPPRMWSEETKASFASDPFWQEAIERRRREKQAGPGGEVLAAVNGMGMKLRDDVCIWADVGLEWAVGQKREDLRGEFEKRGWTAELVDRLPPPPDPWGLASAREPEQDESYQLDEADSFAGWLETQGIYGGAND